MSASTSNETRQVDELVAAYCVLGRTNRRGRWRRRASLLGTCAIAGAALWGAWQQDLHLQLLERVPARELLDLRSAITLQREELTAARAELAAERNRFEARNTALDAQLAAFAQNFSALQSQQETTSAQGAELRAALNEIDAQREALLAAQARGPALERELAAISAERRSLEDRWRQFSDQGTQLTNDLATLAIERRSLEAERASMDQQRRDLESMLDIAGRDAAAAPFDTTTSGVFAPDLDPTLGPFLAAAVDANALDDMRGGILFGNGMNVAIGLTRTAAINGEQQFSSSLRLDDFGASLDPGVLQNVGQFVIQNGGGNSLSADFVNSWQDGFGTVIQNSLDNQEISTATIYDVSIQDVAYTMQGMAAFKALTDSLSLQR
jgi:hypothetical protein